MYDDTYAAEIALYMPYIINLPLQLKYAIRALCVRAGCIVLD
jgi:hypothetical protein